MKKSELKSIIKPIVKECVQESVQEILLESGLLSSVISEVVAGMRGQMVMEQVEPEPQPFFKTRKPKKESTVSKMMKESRRKMMQELGGDPREIRQEVEVEKPKNVPSININGFDPFEGTTSMRQDGHIRKTDAGVNIGALFESDKFSKIFSREVEHLHEDIEEREE